MDAQPPLVMSFATLDEAESALDWIGVDLTEGDGVFEGVLRPDDRAMLDEVVADPETPAPVRELALALLGLLAAVGAEAPQAWRVSFDI